MIHAKRYHVREFANMAGVTVRTLQYYDRIGLMTPSDKTEANHRLYERKDLLKLQQILTLKQLGFTLKEIKSMLNHPNLDLRSALGAQQQAIDAQIKQLQSVSDAMEYAMQVLDTTENWDWETVQVIIQGVTDRKYLEWVRQYFSDELLETLTEQARTIPMEEITSAQEKWQSIANDIGENQHLAPDHPILQEIAHQADELIQAFTQGNPQVESALTRMYEQPDDIPPVYRIFDGDLMTFYRQVMDVYYQNKKENDENSCP